MSVRLVNTDRPSIDKDFETPVLPSGPKPFVKDLLWYGLGEGWINLVGTRLPAIQRNNIFEVEVDDSRILKISNIEEAIAFSNQYGLKDDAGDISSIDWEKVAKSFSGIEITQTCIDSCKQSDNPNVAWLYSWDVGSGFIWDATSIKGSKLIEKNEKPFIAKSPG